MSKKLNDLKYISGTFNKFLLNLSKFISKIYIKFSNRFLNNNLKSEEDLFLLVDFLFFLTYYDFMDCGENYIQIWNDSFEDSTMIEKKKICEIYSNSKFNFEIYNDELKVEIIEDGFSYVIKDIDDFSFEPLVIYLKKSYSKQDDIELNKFLKVTKYYTKLYIKTIWEHWSKFLIKISSSNVSKYLIKKLFYDEKNKQYLDYYDFTNEKDITKIIDNIRYYVFLSDFDGLTVGNTLSVYMDGEPYIINNEIILSKLSYLSENVKIFFHEIIGQLDIRFQCYLYKDQKYTSPKPKKPTPKAILRSGKEAGEFIEELLFGKTKKK